MLNSVEIHKENVIGYKGTIRKEDMYKESDNSHKTVFRLLLLIIMVATAQL